MDGARAGGGGPERGNRTLPSGGQVQQGPQQTSFGVMARPQGFDRFRSSCREVAVLENAAKDALEIQNGAFRDGLDGPGGKEHAAVDFSRGLFRELRRPEFEFRISHGIAGLETVAIAKAHRRTFGPEPGRPILRDRAIAVPSPVPAPDAFDDLVAPDVLGSPLEVDPGVVP